MKTIYGPVSSWRLGRSLDVNPHAVERKRCIFDCISYILGPTPTGSLTPRAPSVENKVVITRDGP